MSDPHQQSGFGERGQEPLADIPTEPEAFLKAEGGAGDIHQEEAEARRLGVSGVPFFVVNGEVGMSGARSVADFLSVFEQAAEPHDSAQGGSCRLDPAGGRPTC